MKRKIKAQRLLDSIMIQRPRHVIYAIVESRSVGRWNKRNQLFISFDRAAQQQSPPAIRCGSSVEIHESHKHILKSSARIELDIIESLVLFTETKLQIKISIFMKFFYRLYWMASKIFSSILPIDRNNIFNWIEIKFPFPKK